MLNSNFCRAQMVQITFKICEPVQLRKAERIQLVKTYFNFFRVSGIADQYFVTYVSFLRE